MRRRGLLIITLIALALPASAQAWRWGQMPSWWLTAGVAHHAILKSGPATFQRCWRQNPSQVDCWIKSPLVVYINDAPQYTFWDERFDVRKLATGEIQCRELLGAWGSCR